MTLRSSYFFPQTGAIQLNFKNGDFSRNVHLQLSDLPEEMRAIAEGAMAWLSAQLPEGMQELQQVILERMADVPTAFDENEQPTAFSPSFSICFTGSGPAGEASPRIASTQGAITDATAQLWDYLAGL